MDSEVDSGCSPADRIAVFYRRYFSAPLSDWEHSLIRDILAQSKWYGASLLVMFAIGCYAVWGYIPTLWIMLFLAAYAIEAVIKVRVGEYFDKLSHDRQFEPRWRLIFDAGSTYSGVAYGIASLAVFYPMPDLNKLLLIGVFCSLFCAMSVATVYFPPVSRLMLPSLVAPIVIVLFLRGSPHLWLLALLVVMSVMITNLLSRLSQNRYRHISRLNQENKSLVEGLSRQQSFAMKAQASAEQAVIDKSRFLATASHDLRQPLHALGLFHHTLRVKSENASNHELFESIDKSMAALNAMFDSLLDVSRLDANVVQPECEAVTLESIFDVLSQEFSPIAEEKGLYFQCEYAGETVQTDRTLFARILRNLISNAIKFTDSGGVSIVARYQGADLIISVRDTGQGIPEDERENVFHEFYQLQDNSRPKVAGVGLGLSIVCRLCALLDIDITLSVPEGGGTEITMLIWGAASTLDQASAGQPVLSVTSLDSHKASSRTILEGRTIVFIDDDAEIRRGMKSILTQWGCLAVCVGSAEEALTSLSSLGIRPDLVICDLQLANGSSGIDDIGLMCETIGQDLPALLISAASGPEELLNIEASSLRCLTKPVSPQSLQEEILTMLSARAGATDRSRSVSHS